MQYQPRTDWCYGCDDRVGSRRFRQLTINNVCEDCDKQGKQSKPQHTSQVKVEAKTRLLQPARSKRKAEVQQKQESLKVERLKRKTEAQEKKEFLKAELIKEENQLVETFDRLQTEAVGREWRHLAAQRLGWNFLKLRRVAYRVKKYNNLEPTLIKEQVLKFVTEEHQTLKQISRNFERFSMQWIYEVLERLANDQSIEKKLIQKTVGKKKTYETLYRLPQHHTIASKSLVTNRIEYGCV